MTVCENQHREQITVEPVVSTTATLGTEESGRCKEVLNKSQCMDFSSARTKKSGRRIERWPLADIRLYSCRSQKVALSLI